MVEQTYFDSHPVIAHIDKSRICYSLQRNGYEISGYTTMDYYTTSLRDLISFAQRSSELFVWKLKTEHYPLEQKGHLILDGAAYHRPGLVKDTAKVLNLERHYYRSTVRT
ncbi:hypothetical protein VCHA38O209_70199 [Vibrio chagasii]|nr:hypothetical protein VCHA41O249_90002 [Vibrio chagasii]CAH7486270.1 hypothetical protein VCHA38O209_70199 [Vibrio chagasii]